MNAGEYVLISPLKYFFANFASYKPEQHEPSKYFDIKPASEKVEKAFRAIRIFTFVSFLSSYKISKLLCNAILSITKHGLGNLFKSSLLKSLGFPPIVCNIFFSRNSHYLLIE